MAFDLQRFVTAQDGVYDAALSELRAGRKTSHWMWFVFPQLAGLGRSAMAQRYALDGAAEAAAYLTHAVLGPRLLACVDALLSLPGDDPVQVLGPVDALKLNSSMTLFARVCDEPRFLALLAKYYDGREDPGTVALLH